MKNEEVLKEIKECRDWAHDRSKKYDGWEQTVEMCDAVIAALERNVPKKPKILIAKNRQDGQMEVICCSECLQELKKSIDFYFCPYCGQSIDWSSN